MVLQQLRTANSSRRYLLNATSTGKNTCKVSSEKLISLYEIELETTFMKYELKHPFLTHHNIMKHERRKRRNNLNYNYKLLKYQNKSNYYLNYDCEVWNWNEQIEFEHERTTNERTDVNVKKNWSSAATWSNSK